MSNLLEVLVTSDSNNTMWTCCVWDPHNGTSLMTYKGGGTAELKTLSFIGNDYLVAVEKAKPILHVWPLNSHQTVQGMRFVLPGKANAFSISKDGSFCAAGIDEKIYLWQVASGNLLTILNRHYQKVNLIKFTSCGRYFVSAAEDGMVMVWSLAAIATHPEVELVNQVRAGQHDPVYIISDHSLPVTDLCISKMGILGRLYTVSSDRTCKIYDLTTGDLLLNLVFDISLSSIELDVLELNVFVGAMKGDIYQFSLTNPIRNKELLMSEENSLIFSCHTDAITSLSVSLDGETLMSASNDKQLILWHIRSRQPIKKIMHKGSITNAFFTLNRPAIYTQDFKPKVILHSLERTLEKDNDEITELEILIDKKINFWPEHQDISLEVETPLKETGIELKKQEKLLREELNQLKWINQSLYAYSVNNTLNSTITKDVQKPTVNKKKKRKTFTS
ncbi:WD repeat-containing protein 18 [Papilio machaon]|uniref:WD repeat-containing protein 18 n=1 Tax=Papilio machaon TaxID=76193 RepID=UPI001E664447|nr:WD repeat-containing protein 18 [Papilio machaon]